MKWIIVEREKNTLEYTSFGIIIMEQRIPWQQSQEILSRFLKEMKWHEQRFCFIDSSTHTHDHPRSSGDWFDEKLALSCYRSTLTAFIVCSNCIVPLMYEFFFILPFNKPTVNHLSSIVRMKMYLFALQLIVYNCLNVFSKESRKNHLRWKKSFSLEGTKKENIERFVHHLFQGNLLSQICGSMKTLITLPRTSKHPDLSLRRTMSTKFIPNNFEPMGWELCPLYFSRLRKIPPFSFIC